MTREAKATWALAILTLVPRLILFERAFAAHYTADFKNMHMVYDGYLNIAQSIVEHRVYGFDGVHPITTRAPLIPLLMIPGVALGIPVVWGFFFQLVLSIGAVMNTRAAARSFGASELASFLAAAYFAVDPWFMLLARYVSAAVTAVFLITCLLRFLGSRRYALAGLSGGLVAICHPSCAFALAGALAADAIMRRWQGIVRPILTAVGVFILVLSPWIVRNYLLTGRLIPGVDGFGYQYLIGSSTLKSGKPDSNALLPYVPKEHQSFLYGAADPTANKILDRIARQELIDSLIHKPGQFLYRCARQLFWFWFGDRHDTGRLNTIGHFLYLVPLFLGAALALLLRWRSAGVLILIAAPTIAIHSVITSLAFEAMYSLPVIPVLAVMSACAGEALLSRQSRTLLATPVEAPQEQ